MTAALYMKAAWRMDSYRARLFTSSSGTRSSSPDGRDMRLCWTEFRLSIKGVNSLMGFVPRQWQLIIMVKSTIDWSTFAICSLIPKYWRSGKARPSFVRGYLRLSSISKRPNFKVRLRRGQCGFARRFVAPRISALGEGHCQQACGGF